MAGDCFEETCVVVGARARERGSSNGTDRTDKRKQDRLR